MTEQKDNTNTKYIVPHELLVKIATYFGELPTKNNVWPVWQEILTCPVHEEKPAEITPPKRKRGRPRKADKLAEAVTNGA